MAALVFQRIHFGQVEQTLRSVVFVKEIIAIGIVEFKVTDIYFECGVSLFLYVIEDV